MVNASNKGICVEFWRKNNNTTLIYLFSNCLQVLKLGWTNLLNIILTSSVVYIFHKGIISQVLCGYEVQTTM